MHKQIQLVCVTYKLGIGINVLKLPPHSTCCSSHHTCFIICAISLSLSTSFSAEQTTPNCCRSTLKMASAVVPPTICLKTKESLLQCVGFIYITRSINDLPMGSNISHFIGLHCQEFCVFQILYNASKGVAMVATLGGGGQLF